MAKPKMLDAIALLKADHRKVEGLFEKFEAARNGAAKKALAKEICTELSVHTMIEEEIFYPACRAGVEEDQMDEAYVEHDGAKVHDRRASGRRAGQGFLRRQDESTVGRDQASRQGRGAARRGVFAQARKAGLDMEALGSRMAARKKTLLAQFKSKGLPPPKTRSFTGHRLEQGKEVAAA